MMMKHLMKSAPGRKAVVRALTGAVGAVAIAGLSSPAQAVGEGTIFVCRGGPIVRPVCPWYIGEGPVLDSILGQGTMITGERSVIGVITGLLPTVRFDGEPDTQDDHVAFRGADGRSRVIVGIIAGNYADGRSADGTPSTAELALQRQANGVLATALANGDDDLKNPGSSAGQAPPGSTMTDTAQGLAPSARAIVASVAAGISGMQESPQFETELNGFARAMLIMADIDTAEQFASAYPDTNNDGQPDVVVADVIVADIAEGGDISGEGFIPRVADGIVHTFDVTVLAPMGDDADAPVPQEDRQQFIFTRTAYAPASGYNVMGVGGNDLPAGATNDNGNCVREYIGNWYESGRGTLSARNYAQFDPNEPTGFQEIPGARVGPAVVAPATKLRIPSPDGANAYTRDPNICLLLPDVGAGPGDMPPEDTAKSTRYAAGYVAGAIALMQDAYKQLRAARPGIFRLERVPALSTRALVMNSASRLVADVGCWTNQSNFYQGNDQQNAPGFGNCQPFDADTTQQSLDTSVGAGLLDANALHENFQGRNEDDNSGDLLQLATMDVPTTDRSIPYVRIPPSLGLGAPRGGGFFGGGTPPLGGMDPDLNGPNRPPNIGNPGVVPPDWPIRVLRPPSQNDFENPMTRPIGSAIPVQSIGWDIARLGLGYIDYVITSIIQAGDTFSVTMVFNRTQEIDWPNVAAGETLPLEIRDAETQLELEDINLLLFTSDSSGNAQAQVGRSATEWDTTELIYLNAAVEQGPGGMPTTGRYVMRVEWEERKYDRFLRLFAADTEFGLAWSQQPVEQLGGGGVGLAVMPGDVNVDGVVDMADVNAVLSSFGKMDFTADANSDGVVNFQDLNIIFSNFGRSAQTFASAD